MFEKVAFIVGAGAVENSWTPVIKVLQPDIRYQLDPDSANSFFALMVYHMRFMALSTPSESKTFLRKIIDDINHIKSSIARELIRAELSREIFYRKELPNILDKFLFNQKTQHVVISTNWDTVIDNALNYFGHATNSESKLLQTHHLHGIVSSPNNLYLPSEMFLEAYRPEQENGEMGKIHRGVLHALQECNKTILYGLSLNPLDAELCQLLSLGWNSPNQKEIVIIDPNHMTVARRVGILLNDFDYNISVYAYHPADLSSKIQY